MSSFDATARQAFKESLAAYIGGNVSAPNITLDVTAASVRVSATFAVPSASLAESTADKLNGESTADLSTALNVTVESQPEVTVSAYKAIAPSPPLPMSPPPQPSGPPSPPIDAALANLADELATHTVAWIIGGGVAALVILLSLLAGCWCRARRKRGTPVEITASAVSAVKHEGGAGDEGRGDEGCEEGLAVPNIGGMGASVGWDEPSITEVARAASETELDKDQTRKSRKRRSTASGIPLKVSHVTISHPAGASDAMLGVSFQVDSNRVIVASIADDSLASQKHLKVGAALIKVDGSSVRERGATNALTLLRAPDLSGKKQVDAKVPRQLTFSQHASTESERPSVASLPSLKRGVDEIV